MKKVLLGFFCTILLGQGVNAQPISDNAVIPMAITINSILRLNIVRGGNIEFVFNTIDDYNNGLLGTRYTTDVTIASSNNWSLEMVASTTEFFDMDGGVGTGIPLNHVAYFLSNPGTNTMGLITANTAYHPDGGVPAAITGYSQLTDNDGGVHILTPGTGNSGGITDNAFTINWECGTPNTTGGLIRNAGASPGRYSTNILLTLIGN